MTMTSERQAKGITFLVTLAMILCLLILSLLGSGVWSFLLFIVICFSIPIGTLVAVVLGMAPRHRSSRIAITALAFPVLGVLTYPVMLGMPYLRLAAHWHEYEQKIASIRNSTSNEIVVFDWSGEFSGGGLTLLLYDEDGKENLYRAPRPVPDVLHYRDPRAVELSCAGRSKHLISHFYLCHI